MMDTQFFNGLTEGDFGTGFLAMQSLVEGDFWVLSNGLNTLYRGDGQVDRIDFDTIVYASADGGPVTFPEPVTHVAESETFYALRKVSGTGKQEKGSAAVVKLALDGAGKQKLPQPNVVRFLQADVVGAEQVRLSWWYGSLGQEVVPKHFEVYGNGGSGAVDYDTVLGSLNYIGDGFYSVDVAGGLDGQRLLFGVRAMAASGADDECEAVVERVIDGAAPDGVVVAQSQVVW